jgi:hypothetical protein
MAKKTRKRTAKTAPVQTKVATATEVISEEGCFTGLYDVTYSDRRQRDADKNDAFLRRKEKEGYKVEKVQITCFVYTS